MTEYKCGHSNESIIVDEDPFEASAVQEWRETVGSEGTKEKCYECWCRDRDEEADFYMSLLPYFGQNCDGKLAECIMGQIQFCPDDDLIRPFYTVLHEKGHLRIAQFLNINAKMVHKSEITKKLELADDWWVDVQQEVGAVEIFLMALGGIFYPIYYLLANFKILGMVQRKTFLFAVNPFELIGGIWHEMLCLFLDYVYADFYEQFDKYVERYEGKNKNANNSTGIPVVFGVEGVGWFYRLGYYSLSEDMIHLNPRLPRWFNVLVLAHERGHQKRPYSNFFMDELSAFFRSFWLVRSSKKLMSDLLQ